MSTPTDNQTTDLLRRAEAQIDAILRGQHAGWDQALVRLRAELRQAIKAHPAKAR